MAEVTHEFLTPDEAAATLRVGRRTVYGLVAEGELGHVRLGSGPRARIRIPVAALDEFAHRGESSARAPRTAREAAVDLQAHDGGDGEDAT